MIKRNCIRIAVYAAVVFLFPVLLLVAFLFVLIGDAVYLVEIGWIPDNNIGLRSLWFVIGSNISLCVIFLAYIEGYVGVRVSPSAGLPLGYALLLMIVSISFCVLFERLLSNWIKKNDLE